MISVQHLRDSAEYRNLAHVIKTASGGREVLFVPSPGNWGDALINAGSEQFFRYFGIEYHAAAREEISELLRADSQAFEKVIIVGGGGGWCTNWSTTPDFVEELSGLVGQIVVLPTSFELPVTDLPNVTYFRRDNYFSRETAPNSLFCHDMAFFINLTNLRDERSIWRLYALRNDRERSDDAIAVAGSIDVSLLGDAAHGIEPFFQIISRFKEVITDRLHVGIAAAMLGRQSRILPGNYAKAEAVWLSSMRNSYPTSKFIDWDDMPATSKSLAIR